MTISWEVNCTELLRVMINDMNDTPTYSDERLKRVLIVSGYQLLRLAQFSQPFTINVAGGIITPDPTETATLDDNFVNLMTIKAACIVDTGSAILAANNAIAGKDMVSSFDLKDVGKNTLALLEKGWCKTFDTVFDDYLEGAGTISCAVMSPFRTFARSFGSSYPFNYSNFRSY